MNEKLLNAINEIVNQKTNQGSKCPIFMFDPNAINDSSPIVNNNNGLSINYAKDFTTTDKDVFVSNIVNLNNLRKNCTEDVDTNGWLYRITNSNLGSISSSIIAQINIVLSYNKIKYINQFLNIFSAKLGITIDINSQLYKEILNVVDISRFDTSIYGINLNCLHDLNSTEFRIDNIDWSSFTNLVAMSFERSIINTLSSIGGLIYISVQNMSSIDSTNYIIDMNDIINTIIYTNHTEILFIISTNLIEILKGISIINSIPYKR